MPASLILSYMCFHDHNLFIAKCKSELKNPHVPDKVQCHICHDRFPGWTQCGIDPLMTRSDREPVHILKRNIFVDQLVYNLTGHQDSACSLPMTLSSAITLTKIPSSRYSH